MGIFTKYDGASTRFAVVGGLISGLVFGVAMTLLLRRIHYLTKQALGETPVAVRRAAYRALRHGARRPTDPEVRAAAIKLAQHQLAMLLRWRIAALLLWGFLLAINVFLLTQEVSLWRILQLALNLFLIGQQLYRPKFLRSRIALLQSA
ncbi:hypothetical protein [Kribbella sp. NPDC023855]|uniref:hypothetical protein n=1 Tax=Kribbella sp. NPDC023855 TaxID=3154698 RepID=UPI00340D64D5